ncbi:guanylate kinase [Hyphobacterium marinum]|uniref:Guanylate kinase n=1 Tax=Hyphobacterium marinum TaxID=3116574 RepID=A0ABU7M053_9PROT|nr:guanylate kinase [Hyphobacterium sp. Y6023]MEE2567187.1 guanylate kinase [Hyphobacterium sp. Y6023]
MSNSAGGAPRHRGGRRGMMLVLSSPSGAGKTTLSKRLIAQNPDVVLSVSTTTRPMRPGEVDGQDYVFVDDAAFEALIAGEGFYEWARVFEHYYGSPKAPVEEALSEGRDVIFDIDWQGARKLAEQAPDDVVRVFVLPPSMKLLEDRLKKRGQDSKDVIDGRMARAEAEISHWEEYDYVIVNEDFAGALEELDRILHAERLRRTRRPWLSRFVDQLMNERD